MSIISYPDASDLRFGSIPEGSTGLEDCLRVRVIPEPLRSELVQQQVEMNNQGFKLDNILHQSNKEMVQLLERTSQMDQSVLHLRNAVAGQEESRSKGWRYYTIDMVKRRWGHRKVGVKKKRLSPFRQFVTRLVNSSAFTNFIFFVILLNSILITLQMEESTKLRWIYYFDVFDKVLMAIYIMELVLKLYAFQENFLKSGWNVIDLVIVSISILETILFRVFSDTADLSPAIFRLFRIFKALKALRAARALSFLKNLQVIVTTLLKSIPAMASIILLLGLILYIFAIIFVDFYKDVLPDKFGTLTQALITCFQLITLDDWSQHYYDALDSDLPEMAGSLKISLLLFIVIENYICINLFIAVIVNNLERANLRERQRKKRKEEEEAKEKRKRMMDENKKEKKNRRKKRKGKADLNGDAAEDVDPSNPMGIKSSTRSGKFKPLGRDDRGPGLGNKQADSDDDDDDSQDEDSMTKQSPNEAFMNDPNIPIWQRELQPQVFALVASLDFHVDILYRHQRTLDELVDVTSTSNPAAKLRGLNTQEKIGGKNIIKKKK